MGLGINVVSCPNDPDTVGNCGAFRCPRRFRLDGDDPCPAGEGVFVQKVTVCAACNECEGPLPEEDCFTYFEEIPVGPASSPTDPVTSECDIYWWDEPACGDGTQGVLRIDGEIRYFCFGEEGNPFEGADTGEIPLPSSFVSCPCIPGWTSGTFRHLTLSGDPDWWNDDHARTTRSATVEWDCCEGPSPSDVTCS